MNEPDEKSIFKSRFYFDLKDASDDITLSYGVKENTVSTAKLAGKALFNTGILAGKLGAKLIKNSPEIIERMSEIKKRKIEKENKNNGM